MSVKDILMGVAGSASATYVDDVFSTYLYNGTGSAQTINNGVNLTSKSLVWTRRRDTPTSHYLYDTIRGINAGISTNNNDPTNSTLNTLTAFNNNGFSLGGDTKVNTNGAIYTSWSFKSSPKFFDVVSYTGNGANRTISHSLGSVPGTIIVKCSSLAGSWAVYHRSLAANQRLSLNSTNSAGTSANTWNSTAPTASVFSVGTNTDVNSNGETYVAYLFAHDTAADGFIQCGSYTGNGSTSGPTITLGWEPQWLLIKNTTNSPTSWNLIDIARGIPVGAAGFAYIFAEDNTEERYGTLGTGIELSPTGFTIKTSISALNGSGATIAYIAIRRPNKPPTSGTDVFQPVVYTGTNADNRLVNTTIAPDMVLARQRDSVKHAFVVGDRLRGQPYLLTNTTAAEVNSSNAFSKQLVSAVEYGTAFSAMNGVFVGKSTNPELNSSLTSNNHIAEAFKRAPGFFDVVCYTGNGSTQNISHNLGVVPEIMIIKNREQITDWIVYSSTLGSTKNLRLNTQAAEATSTAYFNSTAPTSSVFSVGNSGDVNSSTRGYVNYLFASLPGISKVGTYTGNGGSGGFNGTSQTINCGFSAGARFVLIKRTDNGGDWYVFDSARGIVAASDPYSATNASVAEVTSVDAVDADNSGFIVNQTSGTNLNVTSSTYIYLAIA